MVLWRSLVSSDKPPKGAGVTVPSHHGHCTSLCQGQDPEASPKSHCWPCRAAPYSSWGHPCVQCTLRLSLVQLFPAASPAFIAAPWG